MAKKKPDWVKIICVGLVVALALGGVGFGIYKLVDHFKQPTTEQSEKEKEVRGDMRAVRIELAEDEQSAVVNI